MLASTSVRSQSLLQRFPPGCSRMIGHQKRCSGQQWGGSTGSRKSDSLSSIPSDNKVELPSHSFLNRILCINLVFRGEICTCRHCQRQCKIFASRVNFSRNKRDLQYTLCIVNHCVLHNESTKYILS